RLAGLLRLRFIGQFTGGLARSTSPTRYAGKNWPASGALRAASSLPHTGSKRCAFGSDVPSDSPGTLIHRNASTFGARLPRRRALQVGPVARLRTDPRAAGAARVDHERLARDAGLREIAGELLDVGELVRTRIAGFAASGGVQRAVAGDVRREAADLLRAARAV